MNAQAFLRRQWGRRGIWAWLLSPLSLLVCLFAYLKRKAYRHGVFKSESFAVPVIVVGNLGVGGAGKTPLVAYISALLSGAGYRPGIITRGYKGRARHWPQTVTPSSDPGQVGDEAVMLAAITGRPVVAGPDRAASARQLLAHNDCNLILSDDGYQHLKLARDIDILVKDNTHGNGYGNGWCLPSGPLREAPSAAKHADFLAIHHAGTDQATKSACSMSLQTGLVYRLTDQRAVQAEKLQDKPLHAVAGIGNPGRFFNTLRSQGLSIIEHAFNDHHAFIPEDLQFNDDLDLITTQKDAIKLARIDIRKTVWVLPVTARLSPDFDAQLLHKLESL